MVKKTALKLWQVFGQLEGLKHDVRFSYFLAKNKVALKSEIELLEEAQKPSELFLQYEAKRIEAAQKYSDKDQNGNPKIHNDQYVIYDERDKFEEEIKKLKTKFKKAIAEREAQLKEYAKFLEEPLELQLTKIRFDQLPNQIEAVVIETFLEADIIEEGEKESDQ